MDLFTPTVPSSDLVLHHDELRCLFSCSMRIPPERVQAILALPEETLVADLAAILRHGIDAWKQYDELAVPIEETDFVLHAVVLISDFPAEKSLEIVLDLLSQSEEILDFYLGDLLTQYMWEPICKLGEGRLDRLMEFMNTSGPDTFAKAMVGEGVCQMARRKPALKPEAERWYAQLFDRQLRATPEKAFAEASFMGHYVSDVLDLNLSGLLPVIEELYAKDCVDPTVCGGMEDVRASMATPRTDFSRYAPMTVLERYDDLAAFEEMSSRSHAAYNDDGQDGGYEPYVPMTPFMRPTPKVGRNDPCPCGSGKKYKKCCLGKG